MFCKYCNRELNVNSKIFANHVRWCPENKTNGDKGRKKLSEKTFENYKLISPINDHYVKCNICENNFILSERESRFKKRKGKYFCCIKCSKARSNDCKSKISISTKRLWQNEEYANKILCNNTNRNRKFSSKGEEEIKKYFKDNYKEDMWTSGGGFKYNNLILTRDMYSNKLKIIFEYDGIWHFEDIKGQLKDKQLKDETLEEWIINNDGWRLIRLKEELYLKNKIYWINKLVDSIYNGNEKIIKFY